MRSKDAKRSKALHTGESVFKNGRGLWTAAKRFKPYGATASKVKKATNLTSEADAILYLVNNLRPECEKEARAPEVHDERTLSQLLEQDIAYQVSVGKMEPATEVSARIYARVIAADPLGSKRVEEITKRDVAALVGRLKTGALAPAKGKSRTAALRRCIATCRAAFNRPGLKGLIENPFRGVALPEAESSTDPIEASEIDSVEDVRRLYAAASLPLPGDSVASPQWRTLVLTLYSLGLRINEALALEWKDIDLAKGLIQVRGSLVDVPGRKIEKRAPKTKSSVRTIPISEELRRDFVALREFRGHDRGPVFQTSAGSWTFKGNLQKRWWLPLRKSCGLEPSGFHRARHTAASIAVAQGEPVTAVAKMLGHKNPQITLSVYAHFVPDDRASVASVLGGMFAGGTSSGVEAPKSTPDSDRAVTSGGVTLQ